jgi:hypothetical protein
MEFKIMPLHHAIEHSTNKHAEDQLRAIVVPKDTPDMPVLGGYGSNQPWRASTEQVVGIVASEVLTPLLDKINIFVQLAGKFAEVWPLHLATEYF